MARHNRFSLFAQPLDRAAFVAYFLGAVIPLGALGFVTRRYLAVAELQAGAGVTLFQSRLFLLALIVSISLLSLASFLALRRTTRQALELAEMENQRLADLVQSSRTLAAAAHENDVLRIAAEHVAKLTGARAAYCVAQRGGSVASAGDVLTPVESVGQLADDVYAAYRAELDETARRAMATLRPTAAELGGQTQGGRALPQHTRMTSASAVPCGGKHALVAVYGPTPGGKTTIAHALSTLSGLASAALHKVELQDAQRNFFTHVTHFLTRALDSHLGYHTDHSSNVAHLSVRIGRKLRLGQERLERLHFAALLHDIGMLEIDLDLLEDKRAMRKHPEIGAEMLERIALWADLAPFVRHHHEWYDGSGYPEGRRGEDIPLESRIIGLAEAFESMTSSASYKAPIEVPRALERIEEGAGSQFDPELVRVFADLAGEGPLLPVP